MTSSEQVQTAVADGSGATDRRRFGRRRVAALAGLSALAASLGTFVPHPADAAPPPGGEQTPAAFHYLSNFRTTHLSGRFVTPDGKGIPHAIVYLAIHDEGKVTPALRQMDVLAQTDTEPGGEFAFSVPRTSAVLQAARTNHGNLNLVLRALEVPQAGQVPSPSAPASNSTSGSVPSSGPGGISCPPEIPDPTTGCPPAVPPIISDTVNHQLGAEQSYGPIGDVKNIVTRVATLALSLTDPFSMYPRELIGLDPFRRTL